MDDYLMPTRSQDAMAALDVFYDEFNDVHFFVEDEDQENLYEIILRRMFPELKIARIFPLGGKKAVLDHSLQISARSVYIVDKDFDDLLGNKVQRPMLFYLERYCIENYLIDYNSTVEVIIESLPKLKREEIIANLDLEVKIFEITESIRPLFQLFYCVQRFGLGIKNCSLPAEIFCFEKRRWVVNENALETYKDKVARAASCTPHAAALVNPLAHPDVIPLATMDSHIVVSGKHISALVFHYIKSKYNIGTITFDSFIFRIAKNSSMQSLQSLADTIRSALTASSIDSTLVEKI